MTLKDLIAQKAEKNGKKVFLLFKEERVTYAEVHERSNSVANALLELGVQKGDKVNIMMPNCPEFVYIWFGLCKVGAIMVPINTSYKGDGLKYIITHSDSKVLFIAPQYLGEFERVANETKNIQQVIVVGKLADENMPRYASPFESFLEKPSRLQADVEVRSGDTMAIIYTSGTTGDPKGAMIPQGMYPIVGSHFAKWIRADSSYVIYTCLPLFHANALGLSTMGALAADATLALGDRFSASGFWDEMRRYKASEFNYVGGIIPLLYKQPPRPDDRDNPVKVIWGAAAPREIWKDFEERFDLKIIEGFGTTEDSIPLTNFWESVKLGSSGKPVEFAEVIIADDDDRPLGPNQIGEILIRPKLPDCMMSGYYKMPLETLERARNLWWHTGDLGTYDDEGFFFFIDRKKDCIRRRGENISTIQIERIVNSHPAVLESAAIGVPSDLGEEDVKICIRLKPGETLTPEEIIEFCKPKMAYFMVPRYVEFLDEFPKTPTERIRKFFLKKEAITAKTWDREKAGVKIK